jgi:hypothetical protein
MWHQHFFGAKHRKVRRNQVFVGVDDRHGFWKQSAAFFKVESVPVPKKKHLPLVIVRDINLIRANILEQGANSQTLELHQTQTLTL